MTNVFNELYHQTLVLISKRLRPMTETLCDHFASPVAMWVFCLFECSSPYDLDDDDHDDDDDDDVTMMLHRYSCRGIFRLVTRGRPPLVSFSDSYWLTNWRILLLIFLLRRLSPHSLPGFCPWIPLENFCPQTYDIRRHGFYGLLLKSLLKSTNMIQSEVNNVASVCSAKCCLSVQVELETSSFDSGATATLFFAMCVNYK